MEVRSTELLIADCRLMIAHRKTSVPALFQSAGFNQQSEIKNQQSPLFLSPAFTARPIVP
jgi:hypothetical protein